MKGPIVECVPNFSEGKAADVISRITDAARGVTGAHVLDVHSDADHHRSVVTIAGEPDSVLEGVLSAVRVAVETIDLRQHRGQHPRIGAADVIPFVPLDGATMDLCIGLAARLGERIGKELALPVFLYGRAARRPERENLADVRKGEFEGLGTLIGTDPSHAPDFGPARMHSSAGASAVGARDILVAFNVLLDTPDIMVAKSVAKLIRTSTGGLPAVRALAFKVGGRAQVSTNLLDVDQTPPIRAFWAIKEQAERAGVGVATSEIVGLCPERALNESDANEMRLQDSWQAHLLEPKVRGARLVLGPD